MTAARDPVSLIACGEDVLRLFRRSSRKLASHDMLRDYRAAHNADVSLVIGGFYVLKSRRHGLRSSTLGKEQTTPEPELDHLQL